MTVHGVPIAGRKPKSKQRRNTRKRIRQYIAAERRAKEEAKG